MKEHKHAEVLRAIADGKDVEHCNGGEWILATEDYLFSVADPFNNFHHNWRIKPEPKPDVVKYARFFYDSRFDTSVFYFLSDNPKEANLKITIDGETGENKNIEVIK